jgi:hypothetical protein
VSFAAPGPPVFATAATRHTGEPPHCHRPQPAENDLQGTRRVEVENATVMNRCISFYYSVKLHKNMIVLSYSLIFDATFIQNYS